MSDMTDQSTPDDVPQNPRAADAGGSAWSDQYPAPAAPTFDETRPLTPFQQPTSSTATATPVRRTGGVTAAVLAGALIVGGAAGVGGAAWYDARQGNDTPRSGSAPRPGPASHAAAAPSGSAGKGAPPGPPPPGQINR